MWVGAGEAGQEAAHAAACLARLYLRLDDAVLTADPSPENQAWLRAEYPGLELRLTDAASLRAAILERHGQALKDEAVEGLGRRLPELSAQRVFSRGQMLVLLLLTAALLAALALRPETVLRILVLLLSAAFVVSGLFRALLAWIGGRKPAPTPPLPRRGLPRYTILVPLYREAAVLPGLARALKALDYPPHLLDVKLALEADDTETIAAAEALDDSFFEIVRVPAHGPRTKPKAANYALQFARGEYLVIYDAEDRPEPDQLLKAVAAFRSGPRTLACVQARLNFYNADHCWLTKMFALDYALWFELLLPGLDRIGMPMPLGGTSNHFRTAVLRAIGGWDAFNVTEDADIGIRLAQLGYRVSMIASTTFEEAPVTLGAWLRQRSRWLKGYMQTWLVHMRHPLALLRRAGLGGFLAFQLFLGGGIVFALANPLLWAAFLGSALFGWRIWESYGHISGASLLANNLLLTWLAMISPGRRGRGDLAPWGLTVIAYWALVSLAGYRALYQLITRPFYWEKTTHGIVPPA
jgi:cellulose synthase/poly-beta-1,6-N-acetylglucosamine synthase-like glycosyltransferase